MAAVFELKVQSRIPGQTGRGGPKSRRGCPTCKIRRIKCDETRPYCTRCLSTGRRCEGFETVTAPKAQVQFLLPSTISSFSSPKESLANERESQHLNVFRRLFVSGISGFRDGSGWQSLILQAMHDEPAVRHAAIAFTALQMPDHKEVSLPPLSVSKSFALQQYGKSVKAFQMLLSRPDGRSINAALICSILCISFDVLDGSHILAQQHLENGLRVLAANEVDDDIAQAFARLDVQASMYVGRRSPVIASVMPRRNVALVVNLDEAEISLYQNLRDIWSFLRNEADEFRFREPDAVPLHLVAEAQAIKSRLEQWEAAFTSFLQVSPKWTSPNQAQQAKLLQIHYNTAMIMIVGSLHAEETVYDAWDKMFEAIVRLASELRHGSSASPLVKKFSIDMGVIQPLFVVATKCRVVQIRQQAIEILQAVPYSEGVWNGQLMAKAAILVKTVEEQGLDESFLSTQRVPEFRRVHSVDMDVDPKARKAGLSFRSRPNGMDGEWEDMEHFVTW